MKPHAVLAQSLATVLALLAAIAAVADEPTWKGLVVCRQANDQGGVALVPSGDGGWFVAWTDERIDPAKPDLYAEKRLADGTLAPGWSPSGNPVSKGAGGQRSVRLAADGSGGLFAVWEDTRFGPSPIVFGQHLSASGSPVTGWAANGNRLCNSPGVEHAPQVLADGAGGLLAIWEDYRLGQPQLWMQHLESDASRASGWPDAGQRLAPTSYGEISAAVAADGKGGAFLAWSDSRGGNSTSIDIYAMHVDGSGDPVLGWPAAGLAVCAAPEAQGAPVLAPDGAGGILVAWSDPRSGGAPVLFAQRLDGDGAIAPGWFPDGVVVSTATGGEFAPALVDDGAGGAFVAWVDARGADADLYAQHVTSGGTPAWGDTDLPLCTLPGDQLAPRLVTDHAGGLIAAWQDARAESRVYTQRLDGDGNPPVGWPEDGHVLADSNLVVEPGELISDGVGGATCAWSGLQEPDDTGEPDVFAAHVRGDGTVPALATLVTAEARPEVVTLRWWTSWNGPVAIERGRPGTDGAAPEWRTIATAVPRDGLVDWVDRDVTPGTRAGWRLAGPDGPAGETWLDVPREDLALALAGANPASDRVALAVTLAGGSPARLEVFDAAGRRCGSRDLDAARRTQGVTLDVAGLPPGLYVVRVSQQDACVTRRFTVAR